MKLIAKIVVNAGKVGSAERRVLQEGTVEVGDLLTGELAQVVDLSALDEGENAVEFTVTFEEQA